MDKLKILFVFLFVCFLAPSFAQVNEKSTYEFSSEISADTIVIGDQFQVHLSIKNTGSESTDSIQLIPFKEKWSEAIELIKIDSSQLQVNYTFTTFDTSFVAIPPISIAFGSDTLTSKAFLLLVEYPEVDLTEKAKDVKPIILVELTLWEKIKARPWLIALCILIILSLVAFWFYRSRYSKKNMQDSETEDSKLTASDIAYQRLIALQNKELFAKGLIKDHYIELSSIFRNYIEDRFEIPALEETTNQLVSSLKSSEVHRGDIAKLKRILELSDMVKFAKAKPAVYDHERSMKDSRNFIMNTKIGSVHEG